MRAILMIAAAAALMVSTAAWGGQRQLPPDLVPVDPPFFIMTGGELLDKCDSSPLFSPLKFEQCTGYVNGVIDSIEALRLNAGRARCTPAGTKAADVLGDVTSRLRAAPASDPAFAAVAYAVGRKYGCR